MGGNFKSTEAQQKAIDACGKVLVSAAAGSGKTKTMINRIIKLVGEGKPLSRMLILVYNNASAEELRERLHEALFEQASRSLGEERELYKRQLDALPFASISTIHGFCQSLIRENFDKLVLSPTFSVMDEKRHAAYQSRALENVFTEYATRGDALFDTVSEIFSRGRSEDNLRSVIIQLFTFLDVQPDRELFFENVDKCYGACLDGVFADILLTSEKRLMQAVVKECDEILPLLQVLKQNPYFVSVGCVRIAAEEFINSADFETAVHIAEGGLDNGSPRRKANAEPEIVYWTERAKEVAKTLKEHFQKFAENFSDLEYIKVAHAQNAEYIGKLIEIVLRFTEELDALKNRDSVLSFSDLEHKAAELIRAGGNFSDAFDFVFVDEYQDVNPTQEFIISSLVRDNCFMVGDVKQSIYGFRMADPTIFLRREQTYKDGGGENISFNKNFRSCDSILNFVNSIFDAVMTIESADVDYLHDARFETESKTVSAENVQLHLFTSSRVPKEDATGAYLIRNHEIEIQAESAAENEGRFVANEIKSLVGRAFTSGDGGGRTIDYGDIAILFRSRNATAQKIIAMLRDFGIPLDEGTFAANAAEPEKDLILFFKAVDNPRQDIPFAGFLLSFFGGYSEEELSEIARGDGACFYDRFENYSGGGALGAKISATLKSLAHYRKKAAVKNVAEFADGVIMDFSFDAYLKRSSESEFQGLQSFVSSVSKGNYLSLNKFLLDYAETDGGEIKSAACGNSVKIATFHGFKGLEIPVVFVSDIGGAFSLRSTTGDIIADGNGYIGMNYFDIDNKTKCGTLSRLAVAEKIKQRETKEEMRLFYVALTRAQQYMYLTSSISDNKLTKFGKIPKIDYATSNLDFISNAIVLDNADISAYIHAQTEVDAADGAAGSNVDAEDESIKNTKPLLNYGERDAETLRHIASAWEYRYPHMEATKLAMKYSVSSLDSVADDTSMRLFAEAAETGTAYHRVMENIDFCLDTEDEVAAAVDEMVACGALSLAERAVVDIKDILMCLHSDIIRKARTSVCRREQQFMMYMPANETGSGFTSSDKVLVQGVVDLIIDGEDKIIVDFKNSYLRDEKLLEKYKKQLNLYKMAVESAFVGKKFKIALYSFKTGEVMYL